MLQVPCRVLKSKNRIYRTFRGVWTSLILRCKVCGKAYCSKSKCQRHDHWPACKHMKISVTVFRMYNFVSIYNFKMTLKIKMWNFMSEIALLHFVHIFCAELAEWTYLRTLCPSVHQSLCCIFKTREETLF